MPRSGQVLGLVGTNGIGKSTAIKVLAGKLKPNLGRFTVRITHLNQAQAKKWRSNGKKPVGYDVHVNPARELTCSAVSMMRCVARAPPGALPRVSHKEHRSPEIRAAGWENIELGDLSWRMADTACHASRSR